MPIDLALIQRIKENDNTLTSIDLQYNQLGATGVQTLAEALTTNTTLISIGIGGNPLTADANAIWRTVMQICQYNQQQHPMNPMGKW